MTTQYIIIFDDEKINALKTYAENNVVSRKEIIEIYNGIKPIVGDRDLHCIYLNFGYKFIFSIEEVPSTNSNKTYRIKKLSGSSLRPKSYPSIESFKIMMEKLGMKPIGECNVKMNVNDPIPNIEVHDVIGAF